MYTDYPSFFIFFYLFVKQPMFLYFDAGDTLNPFAVFTFCFIYGFPIEFCPSGFIVSFFIRSFFFRVLYTFFIFLMFSISYCLSRASEDI